MQLTGAIETRICRTCGVEKPIGRFPKRYGKYDKHLREHQCGMCRNRNWRASNLEKYKAIKKLEDDTRRARYAGITVEEYVAQRIERSTRLPRVRKPISMTCPVVRANPKIAYILNREQECARARDQYHANVAKGRAKVRRWKRANPGPVSQQRYRRRDRRAEAENTLTTDQWLAIKAAYKNRCAYCGKRKPLTMDHVVPIVKGGDHVASNIIPACQSCNSAKHTGPPRVVYQPHLIC